MLQTPLHEWHTAHNAKMAPFAGWDMPIQYEDGILAEHAHTRESASIFDICHMAQFIVKGENAAELLKKAVSHNLDTLAAGKCRYGFLLTEQGTVIDDLIVYRFAEDHFFLVVNAGCAEKDFKTLAKRLGEENIENISAKSGKIDLQGPKSLEVLETVTGQNFHNLKYFSFTRIDYKGHALLVSRTGYTGELGYELYCPREAVLTLWEDLLAHELVKPAGLGARDTLRLECGLALYGHELNEEHTVAESNLAGMLTSEADYIGKIPAMEVKNELLVPLKLEGRRTVRNGDSVIKEAGSNEVIGTVASGSFAPSLGFAIAFAFVKKEYADQAEFILKAGRSELTAQKTTAPFFTQGTARMKLS